MPTKNAPPAETAYARGERTSRTDDQRIRDVTPLPPPEHLIRFFPIAGTPVAIAGIGMTAFLAWTLRRQRRAAEVASVRALEAR